MSKDARYQSPVAGLNGDALAAALRKSIADVETNFPPNTGIVVFAFDFGNAPQKGMGYIANGERRGVIASLREWINHQTRQS